MDTPAGAAADADPPPAPRVRIRILGPVRVHAGGAEDDLGGAEPRTMLAALVLAGGEPLGDDRLGRLLWGASAPRDAQARIHVLAATV
ncbi:MAG: hypothetical protein HOW97_12855, partial [Catenulispora sp.]|nr:hypothetical protein [Catenulispora sp.]